MILVDRALIQREESNNPIKVGMVGAGFMGKGIALQICRYTKGMELVAISNRTLENAILSYEGAGISTWKMATTQETFDDCIRKKKFIVTEDAMLVCKSALIDVVLEVTGSVEFGTQVVLTAIENGKHVVLMNAELDSTVGPMLKVYADKADIVYTATDGDQPGVQMNLFRFLQNIGINPVLCGNIKGLHDPYRNPDTQKSFAEKWGQKAHMVTSFADGSKISFEQSIVANGTSMKVGRRGMFGPKVEEGTHIENAVKIYPSELLLEGSGIVDYIVGAKPAPGVFILGTHNHPKQQEFLNLYKLGSGPLYCFHVPYHLCHFEVPNSIARAVIFRDSTLAPKGSPMVDVVAAAKRPLRKGEQIDGIGYYMTYGVCENYETVINERLLPMGLSEGCTLMRDIPKDQVLKYDDVILPIGRLADKIRADMTSFFPIVS